MLSNQEMLEKDCPDDIKKRLREKYNSLPGDSFLKHFLDKRYVGGNGRC